MELMKGGHQEADILERQVIRLTDEQVGQDAIIDVNTLPYTPIALEQVFDATLGTNIKDNGHNDIIQCL